MNIISSTKSVNAANRSVVDSPTCFNVVVNENDMQIIADIVYNDVNIQLLFSGYGLFLALVNVFGFYLIMVSQDRSA